ncbi:MAG: nucleotidyltransferase domain-containing protein [Planctomycetes bacterium]|jgi:predicted nucleotidyltransferase|nr:nucleotidyltransferase domain-containing protein [Planctomycetota bacterium]
MDTREELRLLANKCVELLKKKYQVKKVFLIGSIVKGIIHKKSDIDLVVEGLPPDLYIKALTELWDILPPGVEINLIPFEDAFESLKEKTIKEGELVYG